MSPVSVSHHDTFAYARGVYRDRLSARSRATSVLIALAISGLMIFMLFRLGNFAGGPARHSDNAIVVELLPAAKKAAPAHEHATQARQPQPRKTPPPPVVPPPVSAKLNMLMLSREDFAAADISRFPKHPDETSSSESGAGGSAGDDQSVGQGPHGEKLYNAEWYREPTHAEMATYLPAGLNQPGSAMIACRTIERFRVDDCEELGEDPPGTGLARALRLASWQFLVRPPRVGGKSMVGSWVRIRFDFTREKRSDSN